MCGSGPDADTYSITPNFLRVRLRLVGDGAERELGDQRLVGSTLMAMRVTVRAGAA
jgi:hypothetical protein